jgi:uncharacterized protein YutE (UPF0331/DUF86 family)
MAVHKLDLLENAIDSFNEALKKYDEGNGGNASSYKFAIQHYAHFLELLFKYYVSQAHPLLIYKNPFSKKLHKENTIGLWDAIQFLKNEGNSIDKDFNNDLEWIKKLRNNIEHHKFEMDTREIRRTLGRLTQALIEFNNEIAEIDLEEHISPVHLKTFGNLADEYKAELANAKSEAKEESEVDETFDCHSCGECDTMAQVGQSYICKYCGSEDSNEICVICGIGFRQSEGYTWEEDNSVCDSCYENRLNR